MDMVDRTGERLPGHRLGTDAEGWDLYVHVEGCTPSEPCYATEDGWHRIPGAIVERVRVRAREDGELFAAEWPGETLDPAATDWDAEAWAEASRACLGADLAWLADSLRSAYVDALVAETERLAAATDGGGMTRA